MLHPNQISDLLVEMGKIISTERRSAGISQEYLAELTDLHRNSINAIESGKSVPTLLSLTNIVMALNITSTVIDFRSRKLCYTTSVLPFEKVEDNHIYEKFGVMIDSLRKKFDISRERLSDQIGIHRNTISRIENGSSVVRCNSVIRLYDYFGISEIHRVTRTSPDSPQDLELTLAKNSENTSTFFNLIQIACDTSAIAIS